jgi:hydroxyacid-oxoacid transhydrogenase
MGCCHYYQFEPGFENVFSADVSRLRYGDGVIKELGQEAASLGMRRAAIFTDAHVRHLPLFDDAVHALSRWRAHSAGTPSPAYCVPDHGWHG